MKYIKHPEFSIIERIILDLLSNISLDITLYPAIIIIATIDSS